MKNKRRLTHTFVLAVGPVFVALLGYFWRRLPIMPGDIREMFYSQGNIYPPLTKACEFESRERGVCMCLDDLSPGLDYNGEMNPRCLRDEIWTNCNRRLKTR